MAHGILLAHDLTDSSSEVVEAAADLAQRLGLGVTALHVASEDELDELRENSTPDDNFIDVLLGRLRDQLQDRLREQLGEDLKPVTAYRVVKGEPALAILEQLKREPAEFIVLGIRGRSRVGKLLFGSVAQSVLLQGRCKVLAVPIP
jgi:nucleotide-binding universal stress UspA family protein